MNRILLHACCGPCSTYTVKRLRELGLEPAAFWFNPNIHPFTEHKLRLGSMKAFAQRAAFPLLEADGYKMVEFLRRIVGKEGNRCLECYHFRLGEAARKAREEGFPTFTTTLLISPYQRHQELREVGEEVGKLHGVEFVYQDLRPGFRESQALAREYNLYRQKYCGCIYSEWERFAKVKLGEGFRYA